MSPVALRMPLRKDRDQPRWPAGTPEIGGRWMPTGIGADGGKVAAAVVSKLGPRHADLAEGFRDALEDVDWDAEQDKPRRVAEVARETVVEALNWNVGTNHTRRDAPALSAAEQAVAQADGRAAEIDDWRGTKYTATERDAIGLYSALDSFMAIQRYFRDGTPAAGPTGDPGTDDDARAAALRGDKPPPLATVGAVARALRRAAMRQPTKRDMVVYRGGPPPAVLGNEFTDKGVMLTTFDRDYAMQYVAKRGGKMARAQGVLWELHVPAGTPAFPIEARTWDGHELDEPDDELVLGPGRTIRVLEVRRDGTVVAEIIG